MTGHPLCGRTTGRQLQIGTQILRGIEGSVSRPVTPYYTEYSTLIQDKAWPLLRAASQGRNVNIRAAVRTLETDIQAALSGHAAAQAG